MPFKDRDKKDDKDEDSLLEKVPEKVNVTLPGTVEKIIPAIGNQVPEKAQIQLEGADELYREIRIDNTLEDADGNPVSLKKGADVDVTIEADPDDTKPKEDTNSKE
jgi:hypothetical protein